MQATQQLTKTLASITKTLNTASEGKSFYLLLILI